MGHRVKEQYLETEELERKEKEIIAKAYEDVLTRNAIGIGLGISNKEVSNLRHYQKKNLKNALYILFLAGEIQLKQEPAPDEHI